MYGTLGHTMTQQVISLNIGTLNVINKNKNKNLKNNFQSQSKLN